MLTNVNIKKYVVTDRENVKFFVSLKGFFSRHRATGDGGQPDTTPKMAVI